MALSSTMAGLDDPTVREVTRPEPLSCCRKESNQTGGHVLQRTLGLAVVAAFCVTVRWPHLRPFAVGTFTCAAAATWIKKLTPTLVKNRAKGASNVLTNGPRGYLCTANPDAKGHAFAGSCRKGKLGATTGFGWGGRP